MTLTIGVAIVTTVGQSNFRIGSSDSFFCFDLTEKNNAINVTTTKPAAITIDPVGYRFTICTSGGGANVLMPTVMPTIPRKIAVTINENKCIHHFANLSRL